MSEKKLPLSESVFLKKIEGIPTPFHLYDEKAILENAENFKKAFNWAPGFTNFFAVKACPNPAILKRLAALGFGAAGEGYVRVSSYGHRENVEKAIESIKENLK